METEAENSAIITLDVIAPRSGTIRVSYDGDGMWFVRCNYSHKGTWIYDCGLMTAAHIKKITGKELVAP